MSLEEIKQKISSINAQSAKLNDNRKYQLGMRTQLQSQLKDAVADYEAKYGVSLSLGSLDAEIQSVSSEMEKEIESITNILNLINSGRYEDAERLASGSVEGQEQPASGVESSMEVPHVTESVAPNVDGEVIPHVEPSVPHVEPSVPHVEPSVPQMAVPHVEPVVPHVEPSVTSTVPVAPRPIPSPVPDEPVASSDSSERKPITSFKAILGGSAFNPQQ